MCEPGRRPRSDAHHPRLAVLPHEDHVPVALGRAGRRIVAQCSTIHDRFHVGRVRPYFPTGYARTLGPHVLNIRSQFVLRARESASGRSAMRVSFGYLLSKPQRLSLTCAYRSIRPIAMKPNSELFAPVLRVVLTLDRLVFRVSFSFLNGTRLPYRALYAPSNSGEP